jgi:hypothetical protein
VCPCNVGISAQCGKHFSAVNNDNRRNGQLPKCRTLKSQLAHEIIKKTTRTLDYQRVQVDFLAS